MRATCGSARRAAGCLSRSSPGKLGEEFASGRFVEQGPRPAGRRRQRQGGGTESAFGRDSPDIPVGPSAARAMIDLLLAVDDAITAILWVVGQALVAGNKREAGH